MQHRRAGKTRSPRRSPVLQAGPRSTTTTPRPSGRRIFCGAPATPSSAGSGRDLVAGFPAVSDRHPTCLKRIPAHATADRSRSSRSCVGWVGGWVRVDAERDHDQIAGNGRDVGAGRSATLFRQESSDALRAATSSGLPMQWTLLFSGLLSGARRVIK